MKIVKNVHHQTIAQYFLNEFYQNVGILNADEHFITFDLFLYLADSQVYSVQDRIWKEGSWGSHST